jgi:hypothetical protein
LIFENVRLILVGSVTDPGLVESGPNIPEII